MKDHQHFNNDFHRAEKSKKTECKTMRVWAKNEQNLEKFQENYDIF